MGKNLRKGDEVSWNTSQGATHGTAEKELTSPTRIKEREVKASEDEPQYLVTSDKTGDQAAHRPEALRKR